MKLCITATGNTLEANTDLSFGRAPWFLLVDTDSLAFEAVENSGVNARQGAGIAAAQTISNKGADALLTGRVGPKAQAALEASGTPIYEGLASCSVRDAVSRFNEGAYRQSGADVSQAGPGAGAGSGVGSGGQGGTGMGRGGGSGMGRGGGSGMGRRDGSGMGRGGGGRCRGGGGPGQKGGK